MKTEVSFIILMLSAAIIISCDELFETDLSEEEIVLIAPTDAISTTIANQNFKWEPVKGADVYNLQIVTPGFDRIASFVLDTNVKRTSFQIQLNPGVYQWRVCGFNGSSSTIYTTYTLTIDTNRVFANNMVNLISPILIYLNYSNIFFNWSSIDGADRYRFEVRSGEWTSGELLILKDIITDNVTVNIQEGRYYWGVAAIDNETNTQTRYAYQQLVVDKTSPNTPTLLEPVPSGIDTVKQAIVALKWSRKGANGSGGAPVEDSIYVSNNTEFTDLIKKDVTGDSSYAVQPGKGTFYWRIKSIDRAGNTSQYSSIGKIIVNY